MSSLLYEIGDFRLAWSTSLSDWVGICEEHWRGAGHFRWRSGHVKGVLIRRRLGFLPDGAESGVGPVDAGVALVPGPGRQQPRDPAQEGLRAAGPDAYPDHSHSE